MPRPDPDILPDWPPGTVAILSTDAGDPMAVSDRIAAVALEVERIQDHGQPRLAIDDGVRWRWTEREAQERDDQVRAALRELAA